MFHSRRDLKGSVQNLWKTADGTVFYFSCFQKDLSGERIIIIDNIGYTHLVYIKYIRIFLFNKEFHQIRIR